MLLQETSLEHFTELIDDRLAGLDIPQEPSLLYDPVRYTLSLPGKRIRPYLTLIGCGLCEGDIEDALPAAISIELLHNFTLLHDDIMDQADKRRGSQSVYKKWDADTAILSGDAMYARAFKQLQHYGKEQKFSKTTYCQILDFFLKSAEEVCEGQSYDLSFEDNDSVLLEDYMCMIKGKTAALISGALAMGGAVAGASDQQIKQLQLIGKKVGIAFQIQDDLLDVTADTEKFGKQRGGDIQKGKKTYLTLQALLQSNKKQHKKLMNVLTSDQINQDQISEVIAIYRQLNILSDTKTEIEHHYQSALEKISHFSEKKYTQELTTFLNKLISREY